MDPKLLDYYNRELAYIRELGQEFAQQHPKIAGRLGMHGLDVADPYVERLLEGFAFIAGRIQLKMDAEFPRFSQRLLELVYPHYLAPTPAMGIARFQPNRTANGLTSPFLIPRHTVLTAPISPGQTTPCQFRTAHDVELLPLALTQAWVQGHAVDVRVPPGHKKPGSSLHLVLESPGTEEVRKIGFDRLPVYIAGPSARALLLLELIAGRLVGGTLRWTRNGRPQQAWIAPDHVSGMGFDDNESIIPYGEKSFGGYRLLQEYFACPDRYRFFCISGLGKLLQEVASNRLEIILHFDREASELEKVVTENDFALFSTPIVNLFPKRGDRMDISLGHYEHHLLGDRTRPLDYEIFSISSIQGFSSNNTDEQRFRPLYETLGAGEEGGSQAYFSMRREPRKLSEVARRSGPRTGYIGSEVFVQLVDRNDAPYANTLDRVAPDMLCTNRDLPLLITATGERNLQMTVSAPTERIELISPLTRPAPAIAEQKATWRLLSHLQLNFHTLTDVSPAEGAKVLRELLHLYAQLSQRDVAQQADAVATMSLTPMHVRIPRKGPIVFGRGVDMEVAVDETRFAGSSPWLFGSVLEHFLARHVGINTASRLKMSTIQHGEFATWPARMGMRPIA
ncbi:Uncharacterized protein conserved in bacteria [Delftia tsuruhatensis]|uniref:type VI secretion system baseplate subunit TssF n=1 Tax=Delftia tsuruhatensis TaxID=180282 RepID=UPI001E7406D2|nr:type VI secretion system baseplate subunit TssF [Delftia tsuruhatensis]CAB5723852.1 Uncharacterized protein conserved in bacteria [Delftia tsuruhatensis]CAC9685060.1 Uncharacterized protein conserved in bacteria [Delftia tsuruhatensis]